MIPNASVTRMATLASGGASPKTTSGELARLRDPGERPRSTDEHPLERPGARAAQPALIASTASRNRSSRCAAAPSLSAAGSPASFAASRAEKRSVNDADRLRKYLARFGLEFADVKRAAP